MRNVLLILGVFFTYAGQGQDSLAYYKAKARRAEIEAKAERYIAVAGETARLSGEISDREMAALLALQAYNFNKTFGGRAEDPTIHYALLKAMGAYAVMPFTWSSAITQPILYVDPSGKSIVTLDLKGNINQWSDVNGTWQSAKITNVGTKSRRLETWMDGNRVMVAYPDQQRVWLGIFFVGEPGKQATSLDVPSPEVKQMVVSGSKNGVWVLGDGGHRIWYSDFFGLREVVRSSTEMSHLSISQDGKYMAAVEAGKVVRWSTADYTKLVIPTTGHDALTALSLSPDGKRIILGDKNGNLYILTINTRIPMRKLFGHKGSVDQIRFNHSGTGLVTYGGDKQLLIWDWTRINLRPRAIPNASCNVILEFSSNDERIITDGGNYWLVGSGNLAKELCSRVTRNFSMDEWDTYFSGLQYERTCDAHPANYK
ncbi:MAG TPA: WD40 repeat domain-containing protein [Cyclobacteriaceae bacterium]|nr:WD40 repeat domain-containing protein [Cyclobacteriaceae bacterium]